MNIISYANKSRTSWYIARETVIECKKSHYKKGDVISYKGENYIVVDDYDSLNVTKNPYPINPYQSLLKQFKD